jgi:hypothetical protein
MLPRVPVALKPAMSGALALLGALVALETHARADEAPPPVTRSGYAQLFATAFLGDGLRFNNPYRLATPLGSSAESVSRTAAYTEIGIAATLGAPAGLQHGAALRMSFALEGVRQAVLVPSYLLWRRWTHFAAYGRAGLPIVLSPDATWGLEAAAGGVWFPRAGLGVAAELVGDVFYGAGTREVATPAYPIVSGQLGVIVAYEVLP